MATSTTGTGAARVLGQPTGPSEITTLLPNTTAPRLRAKLNRRGPTSPALHPPSFGQHPPYRRPFILRSFYFINVILLTISITSLLLTTLSTKTALIAFALPSHYSSTFLPTLLAFLAVIISLITFIDFVIAPQKGAAKVERISLASITFMALVMGIIVTSTNELRVRENFLTGCMIGLVTASSALALGSISFVERHESDYRPVDDDNGDDEHGLGPDPGSFKHVFFHCLTSTLSFFSVTLPLLLLHLALAVTFFFLTLNVILRAYDASLQPDGQLWLVNPWPGMKSLGLSSWGGERKGRPYNVHLNCEAVDPIIATSNQTFNAPLPVRTILLEAPQGVAGKVNAAWILALLEQGILGTADREVRVCYWDRPGYGFSSSAPTSSIPHVVSALHSALSLSGELARLSSSSFDPSSSPSGLILIPTAYGTLLATFFAARYPSLVQSILYLSPLSPNLYHSSSSQSYSSLLASYFTAYATQFAFPRLITTLQRSSSREGRVLSSEDEGLRGSLMRSWIEEEAYRGSKRAVKDWESIKGRVPKRSSIVLGSTGQTGQDRREEKRFGIEERQEAERVFVKEIIGEGLIRWEKEWSGTCRVDEQGREACAIALKELIEL